jgi:hypothetical protein
MTIFRMSLAYDKCKGEIRGSPSTARRTVRLSAAAVEMTMFVVTEKGANTGILRCAQGDGAFCIGCPNLLYLCRGGAVGGGAGLVM